MVYTVLTPMEVIRFRGRYLNDLEPVVVEELLEKCKTFEEFLEAFDWQVKNRYDKEFFIFRFYLELVARDWLNPTNKEIGEDLCILFT